MTVVATDQLAEYEQTIARGMTSFIEIGQALVAIRDGKLYRANYATFAAYCESRWGWSRQRAYKIIDAAEVTRALSPMGDIPQPNSERQARELVGLKPEVAAEVMAKAADNGKVTAATIRAAREEVAPVAKVTQTTKSETFVNTETGEVAPFQQAPKVINVPGKPEPKPEPDVESFLSSDAKVAHSRYVAKFHKAVKQAMNLITYPASDVAGLSAEEVKAVDRLIESLTRWRDDIKSARRPNLRSL